MILTDFYKFEHTARFAKSRMDCIASTRSYPEFEGKRALKDRAASKSRDGIKMGDFIIYYNDVPKRFGGDVHRRAGKSITMGGKNLSSVYVPDPSLPFGYGDVRGTNDALIFMFHDLNIVDGVIQGGGVIEVFVARGKSRDCIPLYNILCDGGLDDEMEYLRNRCKEVEAEPE